MLNREQWQLLVDVLDGNYDRRKLEDAQDTLTRAAPLAWLEAAERADDARRAAAEPHKGETHWWKTLVLTGLVISLAATVAAFTAGLVLLGYAAIGSGLLWLALASERARPSRWTPAEIEHGRRKRYA